MGQHSFQGNAFLWLPLSMEFVFTCLVMFKGLNVYSLILAWVKGSLKNIAGGNCRASVDWKILIPLSLLTLPIRDMIIRWTIVH